MWVQVLFGLRLAHPKLRVVFHPCFSNRALVKAIFEALKCLQEQGFGGLKIGLD